MPITYDDIKHRLQPPLDCSEIKDLRGRYFHNRLITNYENTDFTGCVLFHCYPSGILNSLEINPAQSEEEVSLKGADLRGADLWGANLQGAKLGGANLEGADLQGAYLFEANLQETTLEWANLEDAYLEGANLEGANLARANLLGVNLARAYLKGANLMDANLEDANLEGAVYNEETDLEGSGITQDQQNSMIFVEDED